MAVTTIGPHETFVNNWIGALDGAITAGSTTVNVTDATGLPTTDEFRCVVGSEIIRFRGRTSNALAVLERGAEGTTAASHSSAAEITAKLTAGGLQNWFVERGGVAFSAEATPSSVPMGRILDEDGNTLTASDFTWVNQGSATVTDSDSGGLVFSLPKTDDSSGITLRGLVRTAPATPYTVTARVRIGPGGGDTGGTGPSIGLAFRNSSNGRIEVLVARWDWAQALWRFTDPTTFSAVVDTNMKWENDAIWLRITDDGTDIKGAFSVDGANWTQDGTSWWYEGRTAFITGGPDQIGLFCSSGNMETGGTFIFESVVIEEQ